MSTLSREYLRISKKRDDVDIVPYETCAFFDFTMA
jgi:hypothetical protein